jgi:hypothetical protein
MIDVQIVWIKTPIQDILDGATENSYCENYCKPDASQQCGTKCGVYY